MKKSFLIPAVLFLFMGMAAIVISGSPAYHMDLTIIAGGGEYKLVYDLDDRQFSMLQSDPNSGILPFLVLARKDLAEKMGYRKEIYGEENYKMVSISRYSFVVRDNSQDRVVLKKS